MANLSSDFQLDTSFLQLQDSAGLDYSFRTAQSTKFYGRKYKLTIITQRGAAITFSADLRFTFSVVKNIVQAYQFSEITIYNLTPDTETDIMENGVGLTLEAGYENGAYGTIFQGSIRQAIRGKEDGTTYFCRLVCIDGDGPLNLGLCSLSVTAGTTIRELIRQIARSSSVPFDVKVDDGLGEEQLQRGFSYIGKPGDPIRNFAQENNASFYVNNGTAYVQKLNKGPSGSVPELNAQTGLIGMPQQTDQGIKFRTLINPTLTLGDFVHLNNRSIIAQQLELGELQTLLDRDGLYRIIGMTALGDTRGNDWYFDIEGISQTGPLPAMLADGGQNGF